MSIEDGILIAELRKRNLKVFESLFFYYYPRLVRFAEGYLFNKDECEDIVQGLFVYVWENSGNIELTTSLRSYLYQSVRNRCLNSIRNMQIKDRHNLLYIETLLTIQREEPEESGIDLLIEKAVSKLPDQMADILRMKYIEGKKIREIVAINQISANTVKTQLKRAKNKLRNTLEKKILFLFQFF